nr:hypothetical protein [Pirellula staleyi]
MSNDETREESEAESPPSITPQKKEGAKKPSPKKKSSGKKIEAPPEVKPKEKAAKSPKKKGKATAPFYWTFPKNSLEDALLVARAIEDKHAGNPMRAADLAKAVGYNLPSDWRYLDLLKSANQYGLVSGTGQHATVSLTEIGQDVVAPSSPQQRQQALLKAFRNVDEFRRVEDFYNGKKIPEDEFFENTLVREFSIPRERIKPFINVFTSNLRFLNLFNPRRSEQVEPTSVTYPPTTPQPSDTESNAESTRVREFLDTCFMMMPFGTWFDKYYKEIFAPAIKDAGFEPIRGDEIFTTGTVVEQIWEQVQKSTVLLADLSDRNANVYYELGLAHAASKPVVLTASKIEDVPFDLRHLRVIVYDVREPEWSVMLRKSVTEYLKNAKADPARSIPQPFRNSTQLLGKQPLTP